MAKLDISIIALVALALGVCLVQGAPFQAVIHTGGKRPGDGYTKPTFTVDGHHTPNNTEIRPTPEHGTLAGEEGGSPEVKPATSRRHPRSTGFGPALKAKSGQLLEQIQAAYGTYCGKIYNFLGFVGGTTPAGRCKGLYDMSKDSYGIPGTTVVTESNMASQDKLLDGVTQLQHTMSQTVTAMTGSLKASPQSCQSSSSDNPCDITCDQHREPEQEVACTFHATILPNIEQYINLLKAETGKVSTIAPINILVDSSIDQPNLRYHQVDVTQYAKDEIQVNKDFQASYS